MPAAGPVAISPRCNVTLGAELLSLEPSRPVTRRSWLWRTIPIVRPSQLSLEHYASIETGHFAAPFILLKSKMTMLEL
jgi:hypothetical protein